MPPLGDEENAGQRESLFVPTALVRSPTNRSPDRLRSNDTITSSAATTFDHIPDAEVSLVGEEHFPGRCTTWHLTNRLNPDAGRSHLRPRQVTRCVARQMNKLGCRQRA